MLCWLYDKIPVDGLCSVSYWMYNNIVDVFYSNYINTYELTGILGLIMLILLILSKEKQGLIPICRTMLLFSMMKIQMAVYIILLTGFSSSYCQFAYSIFNPLSVLFLVIDALFYCISWIYFPKLYQAVLDEKLVAGSTLLFFIYSFIVTTWQNFSIIGFIPSLIRYLFYYVLVYFLFFVFHTWPLLININIIEQVKQKVTGDE